MTDKIYLYHNCIMPRQKKNRRTRGSGGVSAARGPAVSAGPPLFRQYVIGVELVVERADEQGHDGRKAGLYGQRLRLGELRA